MSLDWNTERCDPPLPKDDDDKALRTTLIWGSMAVDLGSITENNIDEWMFRLYFQERVGMDYISLGEMTIEEVRAGLVRWTGLATNVQTRTRKQWLAKELSFLEQRVEREVRPPTPAAV